MMNVHNNYMYIISENIFGKKIFNRILNVHLPNEYLQHGEEKRKEMKNYNYMKVKHTHTHTHTPALPHVDQRMVEHPENSEDDSIPSSQHNQHGRQSQPSVGSAVQSQVSVLLCHPPHEGGHSRHGSEGSAAVSWHLR